MDCAGATARTIEVMLAGRRRRCFAGLGLLLACAPVVAPAPAPAEPRVLAPWPSSVRPVPAHECDTEVCWETRAADATRRGDLDVAAELRGRAYRHAPTAARLDAWADAWLAVGATERARGVLEAARRDGARRGDDALAATLGRRLAALPGAAIGRPISSPAPGEALRAAYVELAAGRGDPAALVAAGADDPYHLVQAAGLAWARRDEPLARRLWARARAAYDERGATLELEVVERWESGHMGWRGEELMRAEDLMPRGETRRAAAALQFIGPDGARRRRLLFADHVEGLGVVAGGRAVVLLHDGTLTEHDAASGIALRTLVTSGEDEDDIEEFVLDGAGDELRILARREETAVLTDAAGRALAQYTLTEWETWKPALALGPGGCLVAIGEEGPQIRINDRCGGAQHVGTYPWPAGSARLGDDRPDVRGVLATGFTPAGDALVAVDSLGEITTWALPGGRLRRRVPGRCSHAEALATRDPDDDEPIDVAAELRCGLVGVAAVAADGDTVATGGMAGHLRVRSASSGRSLAALRTDLGDIEALAFAPGGELAVGVDGGGPLRWRRGATKLAGAEEDERPRSRAPAIDDEGRRLTFLRDGGAVQWDLATGERVTVKPGPGERVLAVVDAGRRVWVRTPEAVALRDIRTGAEALRVATPRGAEVQVGEAPPGWALLAVQAAGNWDHHIVGPGPPRRIRLDDRATQLSPGGRWLARVDGDEPLMLWDGVTGAHEHALGATATQAAFTGDGEMVAWITEWDRETRRAEVRARRLDSAGAIDVTLELGDRPLDLAIADDGAEVLILVPRGLIRWSPAVGHRTEHLREAAVHGLEVALIGGGATLLVTRTGQLLEVVSNDAELRTLATVAPLDGGGWVATGRSGVVDGSPDAPDHLITRVARGDEAQVFDGHLAWDGARVPGLLPRVVLGEEVQPPGLVRAASRASGVRTREVLDGSPFKAPGRAPAKKL